MYKTGAVGALLDLYERALSDLKNIIADIPDKTLTIVCDPDTTDDNCKSLQTILSHVLHSGYGYATSIHNSKGPPLQRPGKIYYTTLKEYLDKLDDMFAYNEKIFESIKDEELEQQNDSLKIISYWGQLYDIEQLTEHAIVHILRHKRQIEKIKQNQLALLIAGG